MPTLIDAAYAFVLLVVTTVYEYTYFWPRFRADVAAERAGARTRAYRRGVIGQWSLTLVAIAIWIANRRAWADMGLTMPAGWRLAVALLVIALGLALLAVQLWSVARLPVQRRVAARPQLGAVAFMLPRTRHDEQWFVALSVTAGFCEELLYRGYLPWLFAPWLGRVGAMILVVLLFGASHAYQGRRGAIRATLAGAVMVGIVLATSSVIPGMIVHALIDIGGGTVGYWLLREYPQAPGQSAPRADVAHAEVGG